MKKIITIFCVFSLSLTAQVTVNVNGIPPTTFNDLDAARNYIRNYNDSMTSNIIVNIAPGTYTLTETLEFTSEDSGTNNHNIIYQAADPNNKPIISGGQQITGWTLHDSSKNIWKAYVGNLYSRQLYVNGERAIRARSEDNFNLYETKTGYFSTCTNFSDWENVKDMEIVSCIHWRNHRIPINSVCGNNVNVDNTFWNYIHSHQFFKSAPVKWLENNYKLIDNENEWYINKTNDSIYYKPENGYNPNSLNIVIPILEKLIDGQGTNDNRVSNLKFINIDFCYTTWNKPSELNNLNNSNFGFTSKQADDTKSDELGLEQIPGAITFKYSNNINFENNTIRHIGSTGLSFLIGSSNNIICNNIIRDVSGSGIYLGDFDNHPDPCLHPRLDSTYYGTFCFGNNSNHDFVLLNNNKINNNNISNIANEYFGCVGIQVSFARNTEVSHNSISNFPYTGISFGQGLNRFFEHGNQNKITYNNIDCSFQFMGDGGGIYTESNLGEISTMINNNPIVLTSDFNRAEISYNYILNQTSYLGAIYLDQGSSNINVSNNVIDIQSQFAPPTGNAQCVEIHPVHAINIPTASEPQQEDQYTSHNITVENNFYNSNYSILSNVNFNPSYNINISNNSNNLIQNQQTINSIIISSGQQTSFNCY